MRIIFSIALMLFSNLFWAQDIIDADDEIGHYIIMSNNTNSSYNYSFYLNTKYLIVENMYTNETFKCKSNCRFSKRVKNFFNSSFFQKKSVSTNLGMDESEVNRFLKMSSLSSKNNMLYLSKVEHKYDNLKSFIFLGKEDETLNNKTLKKIIKKVKKELPNQDFNLKSSPLPNNFANKLEIKNVFIKNNTINFLIRNNTESEIAICGERNDSYFGNKLINPISNNLFFIEQEKQNKIWGFGLLNKFNQCSCVIGPNDEFLLYDFIGTKNYKNFNGKINLIYLNSENTIKTNYVNITIIPIN